MKNKKTVLIFSFFTLTFLTYTGEQAAQLDECSQKILKEGAQKILNQKITTKADFIFWQQEAQRVITAINTFDSNYAQGLQNQFDTKKKTIMSDNLPEGISSSYKTDMKEFLETLKQFEKYATFENRYEFEDVIQSLEEHTAETKETEKKQSVPVTQTLEKPGDIPETPEYEGPIIFE